MYVGLSILITLVTLVVADTSCDQRTVIFKSHGTSNDNNFYFIPATYKDVSDIVNSRAAFISALTSEGISCAGKWCTESDTIKGTEGTGVSGWKCVIGSECYHMEHIIPKGNRIPELTDCPESSYNIRGNLVMSYGTWNVQLGAGYLGEKSVIYGEKMVKLAYKNVWRACKGSTVDNWPDELCVANRLSGGSIFGGFVALIVLAAFIIGVLYWINKKQLEEQRNDGGAYNQPPEEIMDVDLPVLEIPSDDD